MSMRDEQSMRHTELSGETRSRVSLLARFCFSRLIFLLYLFEVHSICTASPFGRILKSFPSRKNFTGCNFTVNRSCGILNI